MDTISKAKKNSVRARRTIAYIVLAIVSVICLFWFYLLIIYSTKTNSEISSGAFSLLPSGNLINNFKAATSTRFNLFRGLLNSLIAASLSAVLSTYFSTMTAYAVHVYDFKLKGMLFTFILMIMMIPTQVTVLGFVDLMTKMNLKNTFVPLIIPSIAAPVTVFYMKQYMESTLPSALVEAARIDGSGEFRTFNTIGLPLMKPAIAVQAIFAFVTSWNNYFVPSLILTDKADMKTMPLIIAELRSMDWSSLNMGMVYMTISIAIFPVIIVYLVLSKNIVQGLSLGAVKG